MKKCMVISDSFKGTLTSVEICKIAEESFARILPDCELIAIPAADGGEGTVACFLHACGAEPVTVEVSGPLFETLPATYARLQDKTAVIEMAAAAGLPLVEGRGNPAVTTTFGVGQMIRHAVESGSRKIILGLGGSATNDGGCGCASALGVHFFDEDGKEFIPTGITLEKIAHLDMGECGELLRDVEICLMSDVDNPLYGERGAACVFGPQKGADAEMVELLDRNLRAFSDILVEYCGEGWMRGGAGAAGGMGAGCMALLHANMRSGIETVLEMTGFDELLEGCDLVITGEGQIDRQSMGGKLISGILKHTVKRAVPTVALVGSIAEDLEELPYEAGLTAVFSINRRPEAFKNSRLKSHENYQRTLEDILRLLNMVS